MIRKGLEANVRVAYFEYDFAQDGGAVSDITLRGDVVPAGALVIDSMIFVNTAPTSGGAAEIAFSIASAGDIAAAAVLGGYTLNAIVAGIPVGTAASAINVTTAAKMTMSVTVAALTAGKITVALMYI